MSQQQLPFQGRRILITRGGKQGEEFQQKINEAGGHSIIIPFIDFRISNSDDARKYVPQLLEYDWIIFTSKNGVHYFFEHVKPFMREEDLHQSSVRFAVVGEKTGEALGKYGFSFTFMPSIFTAEDFAREFSDDQLTQKVLLPKGNLASHVIAESFRHRGIQADEWVVYETFYPGTEEDQFLQLLRQQKFDVAVFSSPSSFRNFLAVVDAYQLRSTIHSMTIAAIGTVTKRAIEEAGISVQICPNRFTFDDLYIEMLHYYNAKERTEHHDV